MVRAPTLGVALVAVGPNVSGYIIPIDRVRVEFDPFTGEAVGIDAYPND